MSEAVRQAFRDQAGWCRELGSPLTATICDLLAARLDGSTPTGAAILGWDGDASTRAAALPLRVTGALHGLVRGGRAPDLAAGYPPAENPSPDRLWDAIAAALARETGHFSDYLASVPQTNEVARSGALIGGLLTLAADYPLPFDLYELGPSAGLNLIPDRYRYRLGQGTWGDAASPVPICPEWRGPPPPQASFRVRQRRGGDLNPIDLTDPDQRARLMSYIWPDQPERLQRTAAAIALARAANLRIDRAEAADWIETVIDRRAEAGVLRLVYHSITWQYFDPASQRRIANHLGEVGRACGRDSPLAWLRYEIDAAVAAPTLTLTVWPSGEERILARGHPHGAWIEWLAP